MKKFFFAAFAAVFCLVLFNYFSTDTGAQNAETDAMQQKQEQELQSKKREKFAELIVAAQQKEKVRVIVGLRAAVKAEGALNSDEKTVQREKIKQKQNAFINRNQTKKLERVEEFKTIPFVAFETDAETLQQLENDPEIISIEEDELSPPTLAESVSLIGGNASWNSGFSGAGQAIAILDTGVDKNHPFLAGKVVSEGCFSTNYNTSTSLCPGGAAQSTAPDSGLNCSTTIDGCGHGTHVAGIAAGRGQNMSGVAKDANIIAIQVFTKINDAEICEDEPVPCVMSYTSDQIKAMERVLALSSTMKIASVNMSLGGGKYTENCDSVQRARKTVIDNLRSVGIATVVSSGNEGYTNAMGSPACISSAVSVGATDDGSLGTGTDSISSFSNSSANLTLLAPGRWIKSSVPNGVYSNYSGTSMAAPHVAGAFAILKQNSPNASVSKMITALASSGQMIADSRNGTTKSRIRLAEAMKRLNSKQTPFDYDGDGKADLSVYRAGNSVWYIQNSSNNLFDYKQFGTSGDLTAPADFDGDGRTDIAVFRPSDGTWYKIESSTGKFSATAFGAPGDLPVPADYDGDGRADIAVFRPSNGTWWIIQSGSGAVLGQQFGISEDKPAVGDFDGDGRTDISVWRPSSGFWYRINSSTGTFSAHQFGMIGDKPTAADYDGDGKTDISVFRPSNGVWYRINSTNNTFGADSFGMAEDLPIAADYDGDGKADVAVYRPSVGTWFMLGSGSGFAARQYGIQTDIPTPNAFAY
jgi:subtilisin family serine protease